MLRTASAHLRSTQYEMGMLNTVTAEQPRMTGFEGEHNHGLARRSPARKLNKRSRLRPLSQSRYNAPILTRASMEVFQIKSRKDIHFQKRGMDVFIFGCAALLRCIPINRSEERGHALLRSMFVPRRGIAPSRFRLRISLLYKPVVLLQAFLSCFRLWGRATRSKTGGIKRATLS